MSLPHVEYRLYARRAKDSTAPHVILKRTAEKGVSGDIALMVQAYVPSAASELAVASTEVTFVCAAALRNIETFAQNSQLVINEALRSSGVGALVMRESMTWARHEFPGRAFGLEDGFVGAIESCPEWNTELNAGRRYRLFHDACGFSLTVMPDGSGTLSFDESRTWHFDFLDKLFTRHVTVSSFSENGLAESVAYARAASDSGFIFL